MPPFAPGDRFALFVLWSVFFGAGCKFVLDESVEACMRLVQVVVVSPHFDDFVGVALGVDKMFVEAFVPETAIKALDETVLRGLPEWAVVPFDTVVALPFPDGVQDAHPVP